MMGYCTMNATPTWYLGCIVFAFTFFLFPLPPQSPLLQKAMLEVTDYIEKSVVPEGLTVSPPYPMSEEDGKKVGKRRREKRGNGQDKVAPITCDALVPHFTKLFSHPGSGGRGS